VRVRHNPKRNHDATRTPGTLGSADRFALHQDGRSVEAHIAEMMKHGVPATLTRADIRWDRKHGFIEILPPDASNVVALKPTAAVPPAAMPPAATDRARGERMTVSIKDLLRPEPALSLNLSNLDDLLPDPLLESVFAVYGRDHRDDEGKDQ
jgi:hypothetical protein